jgi:putative spermidine/putrescine transport system substrate-binding protein
MNNRNLLLVALLFGCFLLFACQRASAPTPSFSPATLAKTEWRTIEEAAKGTTVNFAMWAGDEARNRFFQSQVTKELKEKYGISLQIMPLGDTAEAISKLLNEKSAGKSSNGSIDMIWINGENFRTAKQGQLLWGRFADFLPHQKHYAVEAGNRDFGTEIEGLEAPWQHAQFVLAYDTARISDPPRSIAELGDWIKTHPGRFTYIAPPDFTGSAFLRHVLFHFGGGAQNFQTFRQEFYDQAAAKTFAFLNEIKPFLWRQGETYPSSLKELDRLFANGEVDFAFSYGATFASERIKRGEYAPTVRTFLFKDGTISNYNFLTIPFNATNPAGALVVINYLMSPAFQIEQAHVLGSVYPHKLETLNEEQRQAVDKIERGPATLSNEELHAHAVPEADVSYLEKLEKDWRAQVLVK